MTPEAKRLINMYERDIEKIEDDIHEWTDYRDWCIENNNLEASFWGDLIDNGNSEIEDKRYKIIEIKTGLYQGERNK
jgi:hypothetical protein